MLDKNSKFYKHMRQVHMDFHMPEFPIKAIENFNSEKFVSELIRGKINMVALFAKCHFGNSFYNTKVGHKHAGLKEDFLMEVTTKCKENDIFTYAYYSLNTDLRAYKEHENWRYVNREGDYSGIKGPWAMLCTNTPYKEEMVLPQLEEIIKDYPVDAFWIDIPFPKHADTCYCPHCQAKYRQMYGKELKDAALKDRLAFYQASVGKFIKEIKVLIKKYNKDIMVATNTAGNIIKARTFTHENDILVWESQPKNNYLSHSYVSRYVRTLDIPCQVMSVRFYQGWGDLTLKPTAQMTTEFAAMIANGCTAVSGDQVNVDGTLQAPVYDMFAKSFGFVEAREDMLRKGVTVKDTAILVPVPGKELPGINADTEYTKGAHKALVESHVQFDILSSVDTHLLDSYKYIILPEPNDYSDEIYPLLREWVEKGGTLIAVGRSLVKNGKMMLEDMFAINYLEPSPFSVSHFKPKPEVKGETDDLQLQCLAETQKVINKGATVLADYIYPQGESIPERAFRNHRCAPPKDEISPYPFATVNKYGEGKAVYVAGSIFKAYWDKNHHWLRQFVAGLMDYLNQEPLYKVQLPTTVETNMMQLDNGDLLLNIIDYQVGHQGSNTAIPSIEKVYPFYNAKCQVKAKNVNKVVLEPENKEISFSSDGDYIKFTIPEFTIMAMVRIEFK